MIPFFLRKVDCQHGRTHRGDASLAKTSQYHSFTSDEQRHQSSRLLPSSWSPNLFPLILGAVLFLPWVTASAQDMRMHSGSPLKQLQQDIEEQDGYLPMEDFHMMSKELGLPPSDLRLRALFHPEARQEHLRQKEAQEEAARQAPSRTSNKLFAHVIQESGGKPIITKEEIMAPHLKYLEDNKERALQIAMEKIQEGQQAAREQFTIPPLPSCLLSYTDKTELRQKVEGRETDIIGDFLFVGPQHITTNSKEIFGESVHLIVYDSSKPSPFGLLAKNYEVSCLPYRIRSTGTFLFKHYGEHALRNYNGDPHGDGEKLL